MNEVKEGFVTNVGFELNFEGWWDLLASATQRIVAETWN